jgi:hypothetical protein
MSTTKSTRAQLITELRKARKENQQIAADLEAMKGRLTEITSQKSPEQDYLEDVRNVADEFKRKWKAGEFEDREAADTWMNETIDGHGRVIYTRQAQECLRYSDNDGAYVDEYGTDGLAEDGCLNWSRLAYAAFMADVYEDIDDRSDIDRNEEPPSAPEST